MKSITVYQTDADGAFVHPVTAHELAQSPGIYNVPFGAKLVAPPEVPAGHAAVAVGDDWVALEDHRQDMLYVVASGQPYAFKTTIAVNQAAVRYTGLGPVPNWLTPEAPAPAPQVEEPRQGQEEEQEKEGEEQEGQ